MNSLQKWNPFEFSRSEKRKANGENVAIQRTPASTALALHNQLNRAFDDTLSERFWREPFAFDDLDPFFGHYAPATYIPAVDLVDDGKYEFDEEVADDVTCEPTTAGDYAHDDAIAR